MNGKVVCFDNGFYTVMVFTPGTPSYRLTASQLHGAKIGDRVRLQCVSGLWSVVEILEPSQAGTV